MVSLARVIQHMYPVSQPLRDWVCGNDGTGDRVTFWAPSLGPQPTQAEIDAARPAAQAAADAEAADLAAYEADKATLKSAIVTAATRLQAIRDNASPNNAQVIAAVRDLANFQLQTIKALRRML